MYFIKLVILQILEKLFKDLILAVKYFISIKVKCKSESCVFYFNYFTLLRFIKVFRIMERCNIF